MNERYIAEILLIWKQMQGIELQMIDGENEKLSVLDIWTFRSLVAGTRNVFQNNQRKKIVSERELFSELTEPPRIVISKLTF